MSFISKVASACLAVLTLAACSTGPASTSQNGGSPSATGSSGAVQTAATDSFPITVKHALGEVTITEEPKRIATLGWTDHEVAASLGVVPVGAVATTWGGNANQSTDWFDAKVAELGAAAPTRYADTDGAPVEAIAKLQPDLILATNSGITEAEYATLSKIAPVVAYPTGPWATTWQESLQLVGKALGRSEQAAQVEQQTLDAIKTKSAQYPQLAGKSAAFVWFAANDYSKIGIYANKDARPVFLEQVGFGVPSIVKELSAAKPGLFSVEISAERAADVDADVLMFYATDGVSADAITSAALLKNIPAIARGSYVIADDPVKALPLSAPSPLSIPVALDTFLPQLAQAADKAK